MKIQNEALLSEYIEKYNLRKRFAPGRLPAFELFKFKKGDLLLRAGELSENIFFLLEGKLKVYNYSSDGKIIFLSQLGPFEIIGEIASLWGWEATANVEAVTDVICAGILLNTHRDLLLNDLEFLRFLCQKMALKTISNNKYFSTTLFNSTESRLAALIIAHADNSVFTPRLSEWAELLITSYRHLLRTLNRLIKKGVLEKQGRKYIILDMETLRRIANQGL